MISRDMICIRCPLGCELTVVQDGDAISVTGNTCRRGEEYGIQEMRCPMRTVTSSVRVMGGVRPLCSVKTRELVRKADIARVLEAIAEMRVSAPVTLGQVLCEDIAGTGAALVATRSVASGQ